MTKNTATRHAVTFLELLKQDIDRTEKHKTYYVPLADKAGLTVTHIANILDVDESEVRTILDGQN